MISKTVFVKLERMSSGGLTMKRYYPLKGALCPRVSIPLHCLTTGQTLIPYNIDVIALVSPGNIISYTATNGQEVYR